MSKQIILANIGNRNIKYLNQGYYKDEIPKDVFLSKTKFLWEHPEELQNIQICILPSILEKYPEAIVYLFSTLQEPEFIQDTFYEGLIIKQLLAEKYPQLVIETITIKGPRANNEDELITWYRDVVNNIRKQAPDAFFIMYDTGGTPQQKNALKAVVEFYFKRNLKELDTEPQRYKLFQGNDDHRGGTRIEEIQRSASEKLNQLTNIKLLIQHNNYSAAKDLALGLDNKELLWALGYAICRWENMWQEVNRLYNFNSIPKSVKKFTECNAMMSESIPAESTNGFAASLLPKVVVICNNLLSKTINQQASGNYSGAILSFYQFAESYVSGIIEANSPHKVYSNHRVSGISLIRDIEENFSDDFIDQFEKSPSYISFPVQIFYAMTLFDKGQQEWKLINEIKSAQSVFNIKNHYPQHQKLDSLRNAIAHEGLGVTESIFNIYAKLINETYSKFIPGEDPFKRINKLIEKLM